MQVRLYDLLSDNPQPVQREETRSTEEITAGIIDGLAAILEPAVPVSDDLKTSGTENSSGSSDGFTKGEVRK